MTDVQWLSPEEQKAWRAFLRAVSLVMEVLNQDIENEKGISLNEYEVLAHLSESPGRTIRMSNLADRLVHSRSRLTHTVRRLEDAGLVKREPCADDRRGVNCILTEKGFEYLVSAAPSHVNSVRRVLVDKLGREDMLELGRLSNILADVASEVRPVRPADSPAGSGGSAASRGPAGSVGSGSSTGSEGSVGSAGLRRSRPSGRSAGSGGPSPFGESEDAPDSRAG